MRLLLICASIAAILSPLAGATNVQPVAFILRTAQVSPTVSQQPGVQNPDLACGWDAFDYVERDIGVNSSLASGAIASDALCLLQDWSPRRIVTNIAAASANLTMTVTFSAGGSYTVAPTFDKRLNLWVYQSCVNTPTFQAGDPALLVIDGSSGGVAAATTVSLSITNPDRKDTRTLRYYWGFWAGVCPVKGAAAN